MADANAGTRLLRHSAATRLLRASVPLATISAVLGHAAEDSTSVYIQEGLALTERKDLASATIIRFTTPAAARNWLRGL